MHPGIPPSQTFLQSAADPKRCVVPASEAPPAARLLEALLAVPCGALVKRARCISEQHHG